MNNIWVRCDSGTELFNVIGFRTIAKYDSELKDTYYYIEGYLITDEWVKLTVCYTATDAKNILDQVNKALTRGALVLNFGKEINL